MHPFVHSAGEDALAQPILEDAIVRGLLQQLLGGAECMNILGIAVEYVKLVAQPQLAPVILQMAVDQLRGALKGTRPNDSRKDVQMSEDGQRGRGRPAAGQSIDARLVANRVYEIGQHYTQE